ncbi:hypothetical protein J3F83DRAFT_692290 [Trichoderma novae-zelandiae]
MIKQQSPGTPLPSCRGLCIRASTEQCEGRHKNAPVHVRVQAQQANQWPASVAFPRPRPEDCILMTTGEFSSTGRLVMAAAAPSRNDSWFSARAFRPAGLSAKRCRPRSLAGEGLWGSGMDRTPTTKKGAFGGCGFGAVPRSLERRYFLCMVSRMHEYKRRPASARNPCHNTKYSNDSNNLYERILVPVRACMREILVIVSDETRCQVSN